MPDPEQLCTDVTTVSHCWRDAAIRKMGDPALVEIIEGVPLPEAGSCPAGEMCYRVAGAFAIHGAADNAMS